MKKHHLLGILAAICLSQPAMAQSGKVTTAWGYINSKDYDKARDAINLAIQNESTKGEAKTWFYRGEAYQGIYADPKMKLTDPTALHEASVSYRKTLELDPKDKFPEAKDNLITVALLLFNDGVTAYNGKKYAECVSNFEDFLASYNALGDAKKKIDMAFAGTKPPTDIREVKLYMAGADIKLDQKDKAIKLLEELADSKFNNRAVYVNLSKYYLNDKDTVKALGALDKGIAALPDSMKIGVLIEKLNILVKEGKNKEAIVVVEDAINHAPNNIGLYNALAKMYGAQKNYDKSLEIYNKALKMDAKNFGIVSGMGIIKFNQGVDKYNLSVNSKAMSDQDKYLAQAKDIWKDAVKDLENALTLKTTNAAHDDLRLTYDALSQMYYKLNDPTNGKKYKDLSKAL